MNKLISTLLKFLNEIPHRKRRGIRPNRNKNNTLGFILNLLWILFLSSCVGQSNIDAISTTSSTKEDTTQQNEFASPSVTNSPSISLTPTLNNLTIVGTPTAMPSITKTIEPALLPVATSDVEQNATQEMREKLLQEFMQTNRYCQLPCWWGIELGENLEKIEKEFVNYGISMQYISSDFIDNDNKGYIYLGYYNPTTLGDDIGVSVNFYPVDDKVQFIDVLAQRPLRQYGEENLIRDWENYSISSILQQYGKPQYVYLFPQSIADPGPLNFNLLLYYPELGFKFEFQPFDVNSSETQAELCLELGNLRQISISLYNPEFVDLRSNYLLPPALNPEAEDFLHAWTWEAITGMDLDTFYEIYKSDNPECIQIIP